MPRGERSSWGLVPKLGASECNLARWKLCFAVGGGYWRASSSSHPRHEAELLPRSIHSEALSFGTRGIDLHACRDVRREVSRPSSVVTICCTTSVRVSIWDLLSAKRVCS